MDVGKVPPHDIEAEQAVIGSMLTDKDAVLSSVEVLSKEAFYREDNKAIFDAILSLYAKNEPVDLITVKNELVEAGNFERVGGIEYLASLPDKVPTTANVERYIKIVDEKYMLRNLIQSSNELLALGYNETEEIDEILDLAERKIFDLSQNKNTKGYASIKDVLVESFAELERLYNQKGSITGVPSGFIDLDNMTSGFHGSELIIIAARPAMGKSAFAINIATNAAVKNNVPVVIFNLEMSKEQIGNRILGSEAMVDSNKIRTGQIEDSDWGKLATAGIKVMDIRTKCRKLKMEKKIGLIVIDYLQLIQGNSKRGGTREQEISEISRSLKILAKELDVPVIALSQLSRSVESREDKRPMLSDLRESGAIEQDADIVMFLYRDDYYNEDSSDKNKAEVIVAKHRGGSTGTRKLLWMPSYTKFGNLSNQQYENY